MVTLLLWSSEESAVRFRYHRNEGHSEPDSYYLLEILLWLKYIFWRSDIAIWMHYMDKTAGEEARRQLHKNDASNLEQVLAATPHKTPTVRPPTSQHENYSS